MKLISPGHLKILDEYDPKELEWLGEIANACSDDLEEEQDECKEPRPSPESR